MEKFDYVNRNIKDTAIFIDSGLKSINKSVPKNLRVTAFVDLLILAGIKIIAFDFDLTKFTDHYGFVDVNKNPNNILDSLSKEFNDIATKAQERTMKIACATFSEGNKVVPGFLAGEALIKTILERSNSTFTIDGFYCFNPANYQTEERYRAIGFQEPMPSNKLHHLNEIAKDFGVACSEILLIDSNKQHCVDALMHGFLALNTLGKDSFSIKKLSIPSCSKNLCTIT